MIRTTATAFKGKLGTFMRTVRDGQQVVITDRDEPVARLVPYAEPTAASGLLLASSADPAAPRLGSIEVRPVRARGASSLELLLQERQR